MANNLSTDLQVELAAEKAITVLQNKLAPLRAFTTDFDDTPGYARQSLQIAKATATSAVQTNPTNFESGTANVGNVRVTLDHYSLSGNITAPERNNGHKLQHQYEIKLRALANKILDVTFANFNGTNFASASNVTAAATAFTSASLQTLWGNIEDADTKYAVLDGPHYAKLLETSRDSANVLANVGTAGFDGIFPNSRWSAAGTNIVGLAVDPMAIACAARLPEMSDSVNAELTRSDVITIDDLGIAVQFNLWASKSSRADWFSFDVVYGCAPLDTSAGRCSFVLSA